MAQEHKQVVVYEILGFIQSEIVVRKWTTDNQISRIRRKNQLGQWVRISPESPSKGAGSPMRKTYNEYLPLTHLKEKKGYTKVDNYNE